MKEKDPCIGCKDEVTACRRTCARSIRYQKLKADENERIRTERAKESGFSTYKYERIMETKKRAGLE